MNEMTNEKKFEFLHKKFDSLTRMICKKYSKGDEFEWEDNYQKVWMNIWRFIDKVDLNSKYLKTYISRIGMNETFGENKRVRNRIIFDENNTSIDSFFIIDDDNFELNTNYETQLGLTMIDEETIDMKKKIELYLMSKSDLEKQIYTYIVEGYDQYEIADLLELPDTQIYMIWYRMRTDLKEILKYEETKEDEEKNVNKKRKRKINNSI